MQASVSDRGAYARPTRSCCGWPGRWDEVEYVIEGDVEFLVGDRWTAGGTEPPVGAGARPDRFVLMVTTGPP